MHADLISPVDAIICAATVPKTEICNFASAQRMQPDWRMHTHIDAKWQQAQMEVRHVYFELGVVTASWQQQLKDAAAVELHEP